MRYIRNSFAMSVDIFQALNFITKNQISSWNWNILGENFASFWKYLLYFGYNACENEQDKRFIDG